MNEPFPSPDVVSPLPQTARWVDLTLNVTFVLVGVVTTLLGPLVPFLIGRWKISTIQAGGLFTTQFLTSLIGASLSSLLVARYGLRRLLSGSSALMAIGVAAIWFLPWPESLCSVACYGLGLGTVIPTANMLVAEAHSQRPSQALNTLNFAWGLGAVASSVWIGALAMLNAVSLGLVGLGSIIGALALILSLHGNSFDSVTVNWRPEPQTLEKSKDAKVVAGIALGALFYLYVGTEASVGGWVAADARQVGASVGASWAFAPGFFWAALLGGRALAPKILNWVSDRTLLLTELPVAALGILIFMVAHSVGLVFFGGAVTGLGLATVFPGIIALLPAHFGPAAPSRAGWMFGAAALGGASLPWLVGYVTSRSREFSAGLSIPFVAVVIMLILILYIELRPMPDGFWPEHS